MDIRAMNKRIELYRKRTEKIRAEYRERQQQAQAELEGQTAPDTDIPDFGGFEGYGYDYDMD